MIDRFPIRSTNFGLDTGQRVADDQLNQSGVMEEFSQGVQSDELIVKQEIEDLEHIFGCRQMIKSQSTILDRCCTTAISAAKKAG
jgi:hypothetical protein